MSKDTSKNISSIAYECELHLYTFTSVNDENEFTTPSIISFYMYRMPFMKAASYGIITVSLPYYIIMNIQHNLKTSPPPNSPIAYLVFYIAQTDKLDPSQYRTHVPDQNSKLKLFLRVLHVTYRGAPPSILAQIVPVSLHVVPQQVHDLTLGNSFYTIFNEKTPGEVYQNYQSFIKERYSSSTDDETSSFLFKTYDSNENSYTYDNILIQTSNDLDVPNLLLKQYKLSNGVTYFFFDSMTFKAQNYGLLINLMDYNQFEIVDMYDDDKYEMGNTLRLIRKIPLNNNFNDIRPTGGAWIMRNSKNELMHKKIINERTITRVDKKVINEPNERLLNRESVYIDVDDVSFYNIESGHVTLMYAGDDFGNALSRYDTFSSFLNNTGGMKEFHRYEILETHFDIIQFDRQYILDNEDRSARYVPISIVNVFSKIDAIKTTLRHTVHFNTIKFGQ